MHAQAVRSFVVAGREVAEAAVRDDRPGAALPRELLELCCGLGLTRRWEKLPSLIDCTRSTPAKLRRNKPGFFMFTLTDQ